MRGRSNSHLPLIVGLTGLILSGLFVIRVLDAFDGDPTIFTAFGEDAQQTTEYAEEKLGREVITRPFQGHDGKFFFVQANDPWMQSPDENIKVIDRPLYRGQRMLYPMLAGGFGAFSPDVIVWAMILVNVLAMGFGSWVVASLAREMGGSPFWGLAFVLNLGFISEVNIDGAGVVAAAAAFFAVYLIHRDRLVWVPVALSVSVLSREAMLIAAAGLALHLWRERRRVAAVRAAIVPGLAVLGWAVFMRVRIGWEAGVSEVQEIGWPFEGIIGAFPRWLEDPLDLAVGLVTIAVLLFFARRAVRSSDPVAWAFLGFVPLAFLFTRQVWLSYFDITRAVAPVFTAYVLLIFIGTSGRESRSLDTGTEESERTGVRPAS